MDQWLETWVTAVCHRGGPWADVSLLCPRCSAVYAGVLVGLLAEGLAQGVWGVRPPRGTALAYGAAVALMGLTGFAEVYGLVVVPLTLKVTIGLWFGGAVGFFIVAAAAGTLRKQWRTVPQRRQWAGRGVGWALLAGWGVGLGAGVSGAVQVVCKLATLGLVLALPAANFACGLFVVGERRGRVVLAGVLAAALTLAEVAALAAWRRWL